MSGLLIRATPPCAANVSGHAFQRHHCDRSGVFSDLGLLRCDHVHDHSTLEHLGHAALDARSAGEAGGSGGAGDLGHVNPSCLRCFAVFATEPVAAGIARNDPFATQSRWLGNEVDLFSTTATTLWAWCSFAQL
jgi:hypothetical protein